VVLLLDEFAALGRMQSVEEAITYSRGYGVTIWMLTRPLALTSESNSSTHSCAGLYRPAVILRGPLSFNEPRKQCPFALGCGLTEDAGSSKPV
jgi:hypothetical protein